MAFAMRAVSSDLNNEPSTSEVRLTELFQSLLESRCSYSPSIPKFAAIYREVPATVGVADLVGVVSPDWSRTKKRLNKLLAGLPRGPAAEMLSLLHHESTRTENFVLDRTHFSTKVAREILRALVERGVVRKVDDAGYLLSKRFSRPEADIFFFEVKVSKWKRALYQAMQARMYSSKVYCVLPATKKGVIRANKPLFRKMGVGVVLVDAVDGSYSEVIRSRKHKPFREAHRLSVLSRLAEGAQL